MAIPDEDVAAVRAATDIAGLIGEHVGLRPQGQRLVGLCPFHSEKSPSFSVNREVGVYYCFGCGASGDAITFVRAVEHLDFAEAVERLASKAGIVVRTDGERGHTNARRKKAQDTLSQAVEWYHQRLLTAADAGPARDYLRSRGIDGDLARHYKLGWAPDDWDACCRALGVAADLAKGVGLGFTNKAGRLQDQFRARVMFPIFDASGHAVGFGGRILPGRGNPEQPKYVNTPETSLYSKRRLLYGLNWAKDSVVRSGTIVVCEGYTDVIGFHQAGVTQAVATCGTALADEHFALMRGFARRTVLAFDADSAGQAAAERVYEWERRHELDVAVARLPAGRDPADLWRTEPEVLSQAVAEARPYLRFRLERVMAAGDLTTAEGRARVANVALEVVAEHPDELVRDQYLMELAAICRIEPDRLRTRLVAAIKGERVAPGESGRRPERGGDRGVPGSSRSHQCV